MANIISLSSLSRGEFDKIKKDFHCSHKQEINDKIGLMLKYLLKGECIYWSL